jgi:type IV pilus assembly protein PilC
MVIAFFWKRNPGFKHAVDRISLKIPVLGVILEKGAVARWTRTLATMFAAGVPLVDALTAVGGAAGNQVFADATKRIQTNVSTGTALTVAMEDTNVFPNMALQMTRIGEETGALDNMLSKVADFYEREVDDAVTALSSLIEPIMIVFLGLVIGTIVVAMYLPIFKLGSVV